MATSLAAQPQNQSPPPLQNADDPIVPDSAFEEALPPLDPALSEPLEPIDPAAPPFPPVPGPVEDAPLGDPALSEPLPPLSTFDVRPAEEAELTEAEEAALLGEGAQVALLQVLGAQPAQRRFGLLGIRHQGALVDPTVYQAYRRELQNPAQNVYVVLRHLHAGMMSSENGQHADASTGAVATADARRRSAVLRGALRVTEESLAIAAAAPGAEVIATDTNRARLSQLAPRAERAGASIAIRLLDGGRELGKGLEPGERELPVELEQPDTRRGQRP